MKRFLILCVWIVAICSRAAVPTFESFSDQFQTNNFRVFYRAVHTNDNGTIYPALTNSLTLVTNENIYGTFSLPSKVELLTLGTNYLDVSTNSTWLLNSPTNDAVQVILSLSAGAHQGQLLFITSQNGSNSFTLPDLSEQWDVPGAFVDLQGDWIGTTNRGIILQYTAPDWIEMARFDPGSTGGGSVLGSGTPTYIPYWLTPTTLADSSLIRSNASIVMLESTNAVDPGKFIIQTPSGYAAMDITGAGDTAHFQGGTIAAYIENANNRGAVAFDTVFVPTVDDTISLGSASSLRWKDLALSGDIIWNGSTNTLRDSWGLGSPEGVKIGFPGSIYRDATNGDIYKKGSGTGNTGWIVLSAGGGGATINPTDDFIPYRINGTTFGDSNLKRISDNEWHSFGTTGRKITQAIGGTGILTFERFLIGNAAVDPLIGLSLVGNLVSLPVSINVDGVNSPLATHLVYIGGDSAPRTITNTPSISTAYEINGIHSIFIGKSDVNTVTFQDESVLPGSHLALKAATRTLGSNDVLELVFLSVVTNWVEIGFHSASAGGAALWSSSGGVLEPSPAVDVVSITSQLADDNATNVALVVDTAQKWWKGEPVISVRDFGTPVINAGLNYLTNFWGDYSAIVTIGYPAVYDPLIGEFNTHVYGWGDVVGLNQSLTNCNDIYNYGDGGGAFQTMELSGDIYNFGTGAGSTQKLTNSHNVYNYGDQTGKEQIVQASGEVYNYGLFAGYQQILTNTFNVFNYGSHAGDNQTLTNSFAIYNYGESAGVGMSGTFTDVMNFGYRSKATQSHQIVMGVEAVSSGNIFNLHNGNTNKFTADFAGKISIQGQTNLIGDNGTALTYNGVAIGGGGAPVGTMVASGISTQYRVPQASDTTGTNYGPSGLVGDGTSTNMSAIGNFTAASGVFTNTARVGFGSSTVPSISFLSETNLGLFRNASAQLGITASSTAWLRPDGVEVGFLDANGFRIRSDAKLGFSSATTPIGTVADTYFVRDAAATFQGGVDAASPVPQTIKAHDGSGADKAGANFTIAAGQSTGTGIPGKALVKVTGTGTGTSSTLQAYTTAVALGGTLKVDKTAVGNVGAGEDTLITYTIPAQQLGSDKDYMEFRVWGTCAANTNTKDIKVYFGSTVLVDGGVVVLNGVSWSAHGIIVRDTATTQTANCEITAGSLVVSITSTTAPAETLSGTVVFKVTGTSAVAPADNDIVQNGMVLKYFQGL